MNLLVIDGNSIVNRAFYGIKKLSTKDGQFTNAIYGFLNILLKLEQQCEPECVAVAFDVKAPTFRHKLFEGYKAGRHGMPDELKSQMPILKELLSDLGYHIVEKEGFEADDILGTLSAQCTDGDHCFIATGDRDSLQLINDNVTVLLSTTKMGQAVTTAYDREKLQEEYGLSPEGMLQLKAVMGDSSDNIPGVPGIGQKGASDLITRFKNIDFIFENLDTLEIKKGIREKLSAGKDSAYLSLELGKICKDAPIDTDISHYTKSPPDTKKAIKTLVRLEMFGMIEKFGLSDENVVSEETTGEPDDVIVFKEERDLPGMLGKIRNDGSAYFLPCFKNGSVESFLFLRENEILFIPADCFDFDYFAENFLKCGQKKYTSDVKELYKYAVTKNYAVKNIALDTTLGGYILNPSSNDYSITRFRSEYGIPAPNIDYQLSVPDEIKDTAVRCAALRSVAERQLSEITENEQLFLLNDIELPLAKVLASMEICGMAVDRDSIYDYGIELEKKIDEIKNNVFREIGFEFNLNSPKQLGQALFEELKLPAKKKTKTGYSTNAEVLEELSYEFPVVRDILRYRTLSKLKSTYCDGLLKEIDPDGRIRSTFNQVETRTGRISSLEPNLQNIPVRTPEGAMIRKFFTTEDGHTLVDADYSQIELRVLAHLSGDEKMIEAFNNGTDIHTVTASQVFNMPQEMVTPQMRSNAKAVNFGIVYGIGAFSLSKDIGVTVREADRYIKGYLEHYKGIDTYMKRSVEEAREKGYSETVFHRRRYLPELSASNRITRAFGERVARNMPIQGTAADIIKLAMIKVFDRLSESFPDSRLIMQVHDELIIECPDRDVEAVSIMLREEMENAYKMTVNLVAEVSSGKTWFDAH